MTDEEKKKLLESFEKPEKSDPDAEWTEEDILNAAKRIIERLKIENGR